MSGLQCLSSYFSRSVRVSIIAVLLLVSCFTVRAQDSLLLRFRLDSISIDLSYEDNAARLQQFEDQFKLKYAERNLACVQIDIFAGASPEGPLNHNIRLGQGRCESIAKILRERLGEGIGTIKLHNLGPRWEDLYNMVSDSDEPWRDEVLQIIRADVKADPRYLDPREVRLRNLREGTVWPILLERYLAPLRSGGSSTGMMVVSWHPERDTLVIRDTVVIIHENYYHPAETSCQMVRQVADQTRAWALKTNLVLWGAMAPNLEAEFPLGTRNRWSLEFEAFTPWFTWNRNAQASQFFNLGIEGRYWLGNREYHRWLDGCHIGLAAAGGYYDWEWMKSEGYQGEYFNLYFNIGWQKRIGEHFALDFGLGVGAIGSQYRHYYGGSVYPEGREEEWDQHLIWHDTGYFIWPGPSHANISLVYMFNYKDSKTRKK